MLYEYIYRYLLEEKRKRILSNYKFKCFTWNEYESWRGCIEENASNKMQIAGKMQITGKDDTFEISRL